MKKTFYLTVFCLALFSFGASAQYKAYQTTGVSAPYSNFNVAVAAGQSILGNTTSSTDQKLSTWQTLPFSFSYAGKTVTGYYASDNGYITFDKNATTSVKKNDTLPSSGAPKNAIFAFWQDLIIPANYTSSSTGQTFPFSVRTYTYGTAPNRVHVIQWFGVTSTSAGTPTDFSKGIYFSIRINECGSFEVVHDFKGANAGSFNATIGCTSADGKSGFYVSGSPTLDFPSSANGAPSNAVVYTFIDNSVNYDLSTNSIDNFLGSYTKGTNVSITTTLQNFGSTDITSFKIKYQVDNGSVVSENVSSVTITPGSTYNYSFSTQYSATSGSHTLMVSIADSTLNGTNADFRSCNNVQTKNFYVPIGGKNLVMKPLLEYFTGAWCGYCPNGEAASIGVENSYSDAAIVAVHGPLNYGSTNDQMMVTASGPITAAYNVGFPSATFSRNPISNGTTTALAFGVSTSSPGTQWLPYYKAIAGLYTPVSLNVNKTYNASSQTVDIDVSADFEDYAYPGDIRLTVYIVEDSVTGTGQGWDQHNYMYAVSGNPYYGKGTVDPSNSSFSWMKGFYHRNVLRAILTADGANTSPYSPTWGDSGIIPRIPVPGTTYKAKYTGVDISNYNPNRVKIIAFLNNFDPVNLGNCNVINTSNSVGLFSPNITTGIENTNKNDNALSIFPNPAQNTLHVRLNDGSQNSTLTITDISGKTVMVKNIMSLNSDLDISELPQGMYLLHSQSKNASCNGKFIKE